MSIQNLKTIVEDCYEGGKTWWQPFRKVYPLSSTAGYCYDLSMATGNPRPNYYTGSPLTATALNGDYGIWHGGAVSPAVKHLHKITLYSPTATMINNTFILCDYLLFYPLVDGDSLEEQELVNTVTLPRYTDGKGVKAFLVATNPYSLGARFTMTYTNQLGVSGRQSKLTGTNGNTYIGTVLHSVVGSPALGTGPFIELQEPSDGIRSVQTVTWITPPGGLAALVLVRPLAEVYGRELLAPAEWDLLTMPGGKLPRIYDGAYLAFMSKPNGSIQAAFVQGDITTIWN